MDIYYLFVQLVSRECLNKKRAEWIQFKIEFTKVEEFIYWLKVQPVRFVAVNRIVARGKSDQILLYTRFPLELRMLNKIEPVWSFAHVLESSSLQFLCLALMQSGSKI